MAEQGARYTSSVYLSVTDDANRWRAGPPQPQQLTNQSKVNVVPFSPLPSVDSPLSPASLSKKKCSAVGTRVVQVGGEV